MANAGDARRADYRRLSGQDLGYIKGNRHVLLSHRTNLTLDGRRALRTLLAANKRLHTPYLLKEFFGQPWDYRIERGAPTFFERWQDALKWQRLEPYRKVARMIAHHGDENTYCDHHDKVSLGLVVGLNNKSRVLQRRTYGYRNEEYLKLTIIAAFLPPLPGTTGKNPL